MLRDTLFYWMTIVFITLCYPAYLALYKSHQGPLRDGQRIVRLWKPKTVRNILIGVTALVSLIHAVAILTEPKGEEVIIVDPAIEEKNVLENDTLQFAYTLKQFLNEDKSYDAVYLLSCTPDPWRENESAALYLDDYIYEMTSNGSAFEKEFVVRPGKRPMIKVRLSLEDDSKDFYSEFDPAAMIRDFYPTLQIQDQGITKTEDQLHGEWRLKLKEANDPELVFVKGEFFALINQELADYQELNELLENGNQTISLTVNSSPEDKCNFYLLLLDSANNRHTYHLVAPEGNTDYAVIEDAEENLIMKW